VLKHAIKYMYKEDGAADPAENGPDDTA